jgi:hypothetical protein
MQMKNMSQASPDKNADENKFTNAVQML